MTIELDKLIIAIFVIAIIVSTAQAIVKGVREGVKTAIAIMKGQPIEEALKEDREKQKMKEQKEKEKLSSGFYKITHPLKYINSLIEDWIKRGIDKG